MPGTGPNGLQWRVGSLERRVDKLEDQDLHGKLGILQNEVVNMHGDVTDLRAEVIWMKRAFITAVFTLLGGMILFLVSIAFGWISGSV